MGHTKGDWTVLRDAFGSVYIDVHNRPQVIALVCSEHPTEEDEANAKLIATAPELLEKLKYMVDAWEDVRISGRKDIMETFTEMAKEAIKKATI